MAVNGYKFIRRHSIDEANNEYKFKITKSPEFRLFVDVLDDEGELPILHMTDFSELIKIRDFDKVTTIKLPIMQVYD